MKKHESEILQLQSRLALSERLGQKASDDNAKLNDQQDSAFRVRERLRDELEVTKQFNTKLILAFFWLALTLRVQVPNNHILSQILTYITTILNPST